MQSICSVTVLLGSRALKCGSDIPRNLIHEETKTEKEKKKKKKQFKNKNKTPLSENLKSTHLPVVAKTRQKIEACFSINFQYLFLFGFRYCDTSQRLSE